MCLLSRVVGRGLAPAETVVECMPFGRIAEQQLLLLPKRYPYLTVDNYVIMPNHIHEIFVLGDMAAGASPRPTYAFFRKKRKREERKVKREKRREAKRCAFGA